MVKVETQVSVQDNSGTKKAQCIKIYKSNSGNIGDIILVTIKKLKKNIQAKNKMKKGSVVKALIIRTVYKRKNIINNYIRFDQNSVIILNNQEQPVATKILGPVTKGLRNKNLKILSIATHII